MPRDYVYANAQRLIEILAGLGHKAAWNVHW